ncbi:hypothetical protein BGE01nite_01090 [Brevifollis gellanilyticus]|uniref:Uncharacterized protein n=1 Tax=Brevifollis gellanilyticus TaxID=748831 RepID=A0A512M288_9BACT|nr:hypothetical protein BGE01nite_01090 [Brevifollis gellanilyticus]
MEDHHHLDAEDRQGHRRHLDVGDRLFRHHHRVAEDRRHRCHLDVEGRHLPDVGDRRHLDVGDHPDVAGRRDDNRRHRRRDVKNCLY